MEWNNTLIRCSSIGKIMTEPKTKADKEAGNLSKTAQSHLIEVYAKEKYGRERDFSNKYTEKGIAVEEDSITLLARVLKRMLKKNEERLYNDFISGLPDVYDGETILTADVITDVKSSWSIHTFLKNLTEEDINSDYYWQLQGYMDLTGAKSAIIAYCLVNTPPHLIETEKYYLLKNLNVISEESPEYKEAVAKLEKEMIFDDISLSERILLQKVNRNQEDIDLMHNKVIKCREFLKELEEKHLNYNS